ncbi:MAG: hypothetical protein IPJ34_25165 [Myxococcales bacterium]|nr:hypothetical protein [Myxococcales bacterium]
MRLVVVALAALVGCGGKVDASDGGVSADTADGEIASDTAALDTADTTPLDTARPCPLLLPARGDGCSAPGQECAYATSCGGLVRAFCGGSGAKLVWELEVVKECPATCPPTPRGFTTPCEVPLTCDYDGPCGKITSTCKGPDSRWSASIGKCPGTSPCPSTEPAVGDPCLGGGKCGYDTLCGGETVYCDSTGYTLGIDYALCAGCPKTQPSDGSPCTGTSPCWYASKCAKRNESRCIGGSWKTTVPDCST